MSWSGRGFSITVALVFVLNLESYNSLPGLKCGRWSGDGAEHIKFTNSPAKPGLNSKRPNCFEFQILTIALRLNRSSNSALPDEEALFAAMPERTLKNSQRQVVVGGVARVVRHERADSRADCS